MTLFSTPLPSDEQYINKLGHLFRYLGADQGDLPPTRYNTVLGVLRVLRDNPDLARRLLDGTCSCCCCRTGS